MYTYEMEIENVKRHLENKGKCLVCQPEKEGQRNCTTPDKQDWQTGKNGREERQGTQQHFCLSLHCHPLFPPLLSG